jgi:uncharacterized damage-inducible protein DinB
VKAADDSNPIDAADAFRASMRHAVAEGLHKIEHCLRQLDDAQVWWRPAPEMNSIANLLLHVSGNLRQWIVVTAGGATQDHRDRQAEFDDRSQRPKAELLSMLKATVTEVDAVLASLPEKRLIEPVTVQGYRTHAAGAVTHSVTHFGGHVQEIIHMTRTQLGARYEFDLEI